MEAGEEVEPEASGGEELNFEKVDLVPLGHQVKTVHRHQEWGTYVHGRAKGGIGLLFTFVCCETQCFGTSVTLPVK